MLFIEEGDCQVPSSAEDSIKSLCSSSQMHAWAGRDAQNQSCKWGHGYMEYDIKWV